MRNVTETFLQTLFDNRDSLFAEFSANNGNLIQQNSPDSLNAFVVYDIENIFADSYAKFPTLNNYISNSNLSTMSFTFSELIITHPGAYVIHWTESYPVERFYISDTHNFIGKIKIGENGLVSFVDWKTGEDAVFDTPSTSFMTIDVWENDVAPTSTQKMNYFKSYTGFGNYELSSELQAYIDAN